MQRARLLPALFTELLQSERSAYRHPIREAARLGELPPSVALRAVAAHANETLDELPKLATERGLACSSVGSLVGELVSTVRHRLADRAADAERSYRSTLLEMHHGVDLVKLLRSAADEEGDAALVDFCDRWLGARMRLVASVEAELGWFGHHPDVARRRAGRASLTARTA